MNLNPYVLAFLAIGVVFGLLTYTQRHFFSEGPSRRAEVGAKDFTEGRLFWTLLSTCLWPVLALTGLYALLCGKRPGQR